MSELVISGLRATVAGREILRGVDLTVRSGEVHAVMGPNGAGKSTLSAVVMGRSGYQVTAGSVTLDGEDVLAMPTWRRAVAGLHLVMQYPTEVPGVALHDVMVEALGSRGRASDDVRSQLVAEAAKIGFEERFLDRPLNVDLSGGEKKRNEILQMAMLRPKLAVMDETDSGLDIDALKIVSQGVNKLVAEDPEMSILLITHYQRLLDYIKPDHVHVMVDGRIAQSGGPEVALALEADGYRAYEAAEAAG